MKLTFDIDDVELQQAIDSIRLRLSSERLPTFLATDVAEYLRLRVNRRFAGEGDDVSGLWIELRDSTARIRESKGFPGRHPINRRTGKLLNYVKTYSVNKGATPTLTMPGPGGTKELRDKLKVAQVGGFSRSLTSRNVGPNRPTPPRPVVGLNNVDAAHIIFRLETWAMEGR